MKNTAIVRDAFAIQLLAKCGLENNLGLLSAFKNVKREEFIGEPPWLIVGDDGLIPIESQDPVVLYQDELFALKRELQLNNGRPSLHAFALNALAPKEGEVVAHIGAGTGYYTAVLSQLVGSAGRVIAVEYDRSLYERAKIALQDYTNVDVICADGREFPEREVNCIYVNFAVLNPAESWIENLADGGRAIIQIGPRFKDAEGNLQGFTHPGSALLIYRVKSEFHVTWLGHTSFTFCQGEFDSSDEERLRSAFENGGVEHVNRLFWKSNPSKRNFWFSSGPVSWSNS
ncbi:protein-L-isoaspartate O-methyltransferase family protein [Pararhizobium sp. LjRoot238]|uniref:protein-L-isoaspartate O-methyltransferase family protein n=1 Tax=Pararhizobium sp. LjRoot238 TaxID=3342293 RepID=UPI003ECF58D0